MREKRVRGHLCAKEENTDPRLGNRVIGPITILVGKPIMIVVEISDYALPMKEDVKEKYFPLPSGETRVW
jgi:hypothetical protein